MFRKEPRFCVCAKCMDLLFHFILSVCLVPNPRVPMKGSSLMWKIDYENSKLITAYFALILASVIVSIASYIYGLMIFALFLYYFNILAFVSLWLFTTLRIIRHRPDFTSDMKDLYRGSGFFTLIAGTNMLGSQIVVISHDYNVGYYVWIFGLILWFFFQYSLFAIFTVEEKKPPIERGMSGAWLRSFRHNRYHYSARSRALPTLKRTVSLIMYMIG